MRPRSRSRAARLAAVPCLLLAAGCGQQPRHLPKPPGAAPQAAPAPVENPEPAPTREILGKRTQDVRNADVELQNGAQVAPGRITAKDPITLSGNAYVVSVNQIAANNVKHALDLYQAEHGAYPKNYEEFRDEVLKVGKPDGIALPTLPYYQEYGYDEKEHKLIVLEYPDRKGQPQTQGGAKGGP